MGGRSSKGVHHAYKGKGVETSTHVCTKSLFTRILLYFVCKVFVSYFVVFGEHFRYFQVQNKWVGVLINRGQKTFVPLINGASK